MTEADKYFDIICEQCENWSTDTECEDKKTCPAYKLYCMANKKEHIKVIRDSDWAIPPTPRSEMI